MSSDYARLLQHPKWQKKRLEVLEGAEFSCERCGSQDQTLHVHHSFYDRCRKPWEYDDDQLFSLCEQCHKDVQRDTNLLLPWLVKAIVYRPKANGSLSAIALTLYDWVVDHYGDDDVR